MNTQKRYCKALPQKRILSVLLLAMPVMLLAQSKDWMSNYNWVGEFCDGLAIVETLDDVYNYVDKEGVVVSDKWFDYGRDFSDGMALVKVNGYYGYINTLGKLQVDAKYSGESGDFKDGLAQVTKDKSKWGYINKEGKEIIPMKYDYGFSFSEGLAAVSIKGKWGFINKTGQQIIPLKYDYVYSFSEGLAGVVSNGKWGYINTKGDVEIPMKYTAVAPQFVNGYSFAEIDGKFGVLDKTGKVITKPIFNIAYWGNTPFVLVHEKHKYGIIDRMGKQLIPFQYDYLMNFSDNSWICTNGDYSGVINSQGNIVLPVKYQDISSIGNSGLATVIQNDKYGVVNSEGTLIVPVMYDEIEILQNDKIRVELNDEIGFLNLSGEMIEPMEKQVVTEDRSYYNIIEKNGKYGLTNKSNELIIPCKYDDVSYDKYGLIRVRNMDLFGCLNIKGEEVIPIVYQRMNYFSDGVVNVKKNNKWGYIDRTGKQVLPCKYDAASKFNYGLASVAINNKYGYIAKDGNWIVQPKYDYGDSFSDGFARVMINDKWTFIDTKGVEVTPFVYDAISNVYQSTFEATIKEEKFRGAVVKNKISVNDTYDVADFEKDTYGFLSLLKNGKYGAVNVNTGGVIPFEYEDNISFEYDYATVKQNDTYGVVNLSGELVLPIVYDQIFTILPNGYFIVIKNQKWGVLNVANEEILPFSFDNIYEENGLLFARLGDSYKAFNLRGICVKEYY